jgi:membrane protein implicated in regulation of membrane protease activity
MGVLILILLIIAAVTGTLWSVLKIAAGVALGIFAAAAVLAIAVFLYVRSRVRRFRREVHRRLHPPRRDA